MGGWFIPVGIGMLAVGLIALLRPTWACAALRTSQSEETTYALRIAGMMISAFGLLLAGFAIAYRLSAPAVANTQGAN